MASSQPPTVRIEEHSGFAGEPFVHRLSSMCRQGVDHDLRQIDTPPALGRLGFGQRERPVDLDQRVADGDRAAREVHAGPPQPKDLAQSHPRPDRHHKQCVMSFAFGSFQELLNLLTRGRGDLMFGHARTIDRVARAESIADSSSCAGEPPASPAIKARPIIQRGSQNPRVSGPICCCRSAASD